MYRAVLSAFRNPAHGGKKELAARALGVPASTFRRQLAFALKHEKQLDSAEAELVELYGKMRTLEAQVKALKNDQISAEYVRRVIFKLADYDPTPPDWLLTPPSETTITGVPTLFLSDWHWAEVVNPREIGGVNAYNLEIAHRRCHRTFDGAIDLLKNHMVNPRYPGIVCALGGDMLSGDIHDELKETNELPILPAVYDLQDKMIWGLRRLADEFGQVFVPCVTGNHGRQSRKPRAKQRAYTNYDWLLYMNLAKYFEHDKRLRFLITEGSDVLYSVYGHRYLLSHGDQFRGGDGQVGALGPIIRGDLKKRSRNDQVDQEYDTLLIGHWHQLIQLRRLIVNGCLKGYDEYAHQNNFPFEPPQQGMWITHPTKGITFMMPVLAEVKEQSYGGDWVSWKEAV
jgi:hypothetical protein